MNNIIGFTLVMVYLRLGNDIKNNMNKQRKRSVN